MFNTKGRIAIIFEKPLDMEKAGCYNAGVNRKGVIEMNANLTSTMHRYKIELVTVSDIKDFVKTAGTCKGKVMICCSDDYCINAKSLLGVMVAKKMQWNDLYLLTENDYYSKFEKFMVD